MDLFKHAPEAANPNNYSDLKLPFFQPKPVVSQPGSTTGQVMRTPLPEGVEGPAEKPAEKKEDDPGKVLKDGAGVVMEQLGENEEFTKLKDEKTAELKKKLWDDQPMEYKAGIVGFSLGTLGILGSAFASDPGFRSETIKFMDGKNLLMPLSLLPYHEYFPMSSFKYSLPAETGAPMKFDTEFELTPFLDLIRKKWKFPKTELSFGLDSEYSDKGGFDVTGGTAKIKFLSGVIKIEGLFNHDLPTLPMLVSGQGQPPVWMMKSFPGQPEEKGTAVMLYIDAESLINLVRGKKERRPRIKKDEGEPASITGNVSRKEISEDNTVVTDDNATMLDNGAIKEDAGTETTKTTEIKASNTASCDPQGVTIDEFLKQAGNTDDSFGKTTLNRSDVTFPEVALNANGELQTTAAGMPVKSFFLLPQTFKDKGSVIIQEGGGGEEHHLCPKGSYDKYWQINQSGSDKIKEGEQEHCSDFTLAYNLSLALFRNEVNKAAGQKFKSVALAKAFLEKQTGVHPDQWNDFFWCLATKTKTRDSQKWHTPTLLRTRVNEQCNKAITILSASNLPEIGKHAPADIIKDCDAKTPGKI